MKNSALMVVFFSALLTACGTSVPLSEVPVTDATAKTVSVDPSATGSGVSTGGVVPVDLGKAATQEVVPNQPRLIYFDYDSFVIKPEFQAVITAHAKFLRSQPMRKVAIEGHTDERGGREYNLALGQRRADSVRNALAILGVAPNQMEAVSFGKEKPAFTGLEESALAKNRRAELRYL